MRFLSALILSTAWAFQAPAAKLYDVQYNGMRIYDRIVQQGVPKAAVERVFEFLDLNAGKTIKVKAKVRAKRTYMGERNVKIKNRYAGIIDFTQASDKKRLYVIDLKTGGVSKHHVAHGRGSGVVSPSKFSNIAESKMSSLGLYVGGDTYRGKHGLSLNLYGMDKSNSLAASRDIVMHSATYATEKYAKAFGRLGRSWGCPAVAPNIISKMISTFNEGGVIFAYHADFASSIKKNPTVQEVKANKDQDDVDLPGEEESLANGNGPRTDDELKKYITNLLKNIDTIPTPTWRPDGSNDEQDEDEFSFEGLEIPVPTPRPEQEENVSIEKIINQNSETKEGA